MDISATRPIAVITHSIDFAIEWLKNENKVELEYVNLNKRRVNAKDGRRFVLVTEIQDASGYQFSSYLISPDYYTLENYVKTRIVNDRP